MLGVRVRLRHPFSIPVHPRVVPSSTELEIAWLVVLWPSLVRVPLQAVVHELELVRAVVLKHGCSRKLVKTCSRKLVGSPLVGEPLAVVVLDSRHIQGADARTRDCDRRGDVKGIGTGGQHNERERF